MFHLLLTLVDFRTVCIYQSSSADMRTLLCFLLSFVLIRERITARFRKVRSKKGLLKLAAATLLHRPGVLARRWRCSGRLWVAGADCDSQRRLLHLSIVSEH